MTGGSHLLSVARISSRRSHQLRRLSSLSKAPSNTTVSSMNHALEGPSSLSSSSSSSMMMWMNPTTIGNRNFQEPRPSAFLEQYMKDNNTILSEVMLTTVNNSNNSKEELHDFRHHGEDDGTDYYSTSSFEASLNRYLELERESSSYSSSGSLTSSQKDNILFEAVVRDFFKV